jgi:hypothetical protein
MAVVCGRAASTKRIAMDDARQGGSGAVLTAQRGQAASTAWPLWLEKIVYSACAGVTAMVAGAMASLAVAATYRVAVWCAVAGTAGIGAGLLWRPGLVSSCRKTLSR